MPDDKVEVILAHGYKGKNPGDRVGYDADTARMLVRAGYARYATKGAEKAAEVAAPAAGK